MKYSVIVTIPGDLPYYHRPLLTAGVKIDDRGVELRELQLRGDTVAPVNQALNAVIQDLQRWLEVANGIPKSYLAGPCLIDQSEGGAVKADG